MKTPLEYYKTHADKYQQNVVRLKKRMTTLSLLRLVVFMITIFAIYMFFEQWHIAVPIALLGIVGFVFLLSRYSDIKHKQKFNKTLVEINTEEIKIASGEFLNRNDGRVFQDSNHSYSYDIDLFGRGSFFQCINRTGISEGTQELASTLKANNIKDITLRQEAIKELSSKTEWRQFYSATAKMVKVETPINQMESWLQNHQIFLPKILAYVPLLFSLLSMVLFVLTYLDVIISPSVLAYWLFFGLAITGLYVKRINNLSLKTDKIRDTFRQYAQLLDLIENETFSSQLLNQKQQQIAFGEENASTVFKSFSKNLDALDNRNNIIGAIFGNGWFLTDIKNTYQIEKWIDTYSYKVKDWFEVVAFFDAYNSLGNYAYNYPEFVYPKIVENGLQINALNLGHPLLAKDKRVNSDLNIGNKEFFIVTGANMAGKSTFLRTVSLHIVMANVGLPVCADFSEYRPVKLITSMRTSDSLTDDSSYFFSELTRLKFIVDKIKEEPYFIVLDEILKGTNSTDKAMGSRKFVEKLVASNATGIIATHDLSLCEIEKELEPVKNYYFDAEIINDELHFDYKLKSGICKNMNASFLLKKMDIV